MTDLYWLPEVPDWRQRLQSLSGDRDAAWGKAVVLANAKLDFVRTNQLDRVLQSLPPGTPAAKPVRLAILGSCTTTHLHAALRVAGLRRGLHVSVYEAQFGQYRQELADGAAPLHAFGPDVVLFAPDAHHLAAGLRADMTAAEAAAALESVTSQVKECWSLARAAFGDCQIVQQTVLPVFPALLGSNEHRCHGSKASFVARLNTALRDMADTAGVDLLALDDRVQTDGLSAWHDAGLWHRAKQDISPAAAPLFGDLVLRLVAARRGRSFKGLVLDLDNTLWGGIVGDDGLDGLILGQGSALGEAYVSFQAYARELSRRGIILAVSSKNDEANAAEPFDRHPDMVLKRTDIACFAANWSDKAANIRSIADQLGIGLDSLVFVDDNPFERAFVREQLPMVAVPEVGDDPTAFARTLADAGYFESLAVTDDDRRRGEQYQGNRLRASAKGAASDLQGYLRSLDMELLWRPFDRLGLARIVQLINKTNQFNLTTIRYTEAAVAAVMDDDRAFGLQLRLLDRFGDNGIIAVVIGRLQEGGDCLIDTWLMSCRVLGRQVEQATLGLVVEHARRLGARRLVGRYVPTGRNGMVGDHYRQIGFAQEAEEADAGSVWSLDLSAFAPADTFIRSREG